MVLLVPLSQDGWLCEQRMSTVENGQPMILGRSLELGIPANETTISRKHAQIREDPDKGLSLEALKRVWLRKSRAKKLRVIAAGEQIPVSIQIPTSFTFLAWQLLDSCTLALQSL